MLTLRLNMVKLNGTSKLPLTNFMLPKLENKPLTEQALLPSLKAHYLTTTLVTTLRKLDQLQPPLLPHLLVVMPKFIHPFQELLRLLKNLPMDTLFQLDIKLFMDHAHNIQSVMLVILFHTMVSLSMVLSMLKDNKTLWIL